MTDFAAIDFETANGQRSSVCSVGVVVVRGGVITDTFYSLIHPEPDYYAWFCQQVHGLSHTDTDNALVFPTVWRQIEPRNVSIGHITPLSESSTCCFSFLSPTFPRVAVSVPHFPLPVGRPFPRQHRVSPNV